MNMIMLGNRPSITRSIRACVDVVARRWREEARKPLDALDGGSAIKIDDSKLNDPEGAVRRISKGAFYATLLVRFTDRVRDSSLTNSP